MIRAFASRLPSSAVRSSSSSLLSSVSSSYSSSSSSVFARCFSSSNNEKESKDVLKPSSAHLAAAAAAAAAFLPSAYISLSRDHLLRQADLPEYTRKWPQLWQLTSSELRQNNSTHPFNPNELPYPQPPSATPIYERLNQVPQSSSSSASSSSSSSSTSVGLSAFAQYDPNVDEMDLEDDEEDDEDDEDLTLSQLDEVEAALAEGEERDFTGRLDRVESSINRLNEKLHNIQSGKKASKVLSIKQLKSKSKLRTVGPMKRVGRPKKGAEKAMEAAAAELQQVASAIPPPPTAADLAAFMTASPARAQLYHQTAQAITERLQESLQEAFSSVSLPAKRIRKSRTVKKALSTDALEAAEATVDPVSESDGVSLDSTKRKRRRKMNRHQYKKRKKLERQKNSSGNKKIHIS